MTTVSKDSHIILNLGEPGRAKLLIDDVDMSNLVYRTEFVMEANKVGQLILYCHALDMTIQGVGEVTIDNHIDTVLSLESDIDDESEEQTCQMCGEQATTIILDTLDVTPVGAKSREYRRLFPTHRFCDKHARDPITFRLS